MAFPYYKQLDSSDCGPTCIKIVAKYYGKNFSLPFLKDKCLMHKEGASLLGISEVCEQIGLKTLAVKIDFEKLENEVTMPCIAYWRQNHFVVIYKIKKGKVYVSDPAKGLIAYPVDIFCKGWLSNNSQINGFGIVLMAEPTAKFFSEDSKIEGLTFKNISHYFFKQRKLFIQLIIGMFAGMLLQLLMPFFTQAVVDVGIGTKDIPFIYLILMGQLALFFGSTVVEYIRSWILLHISTRINLALLSDYLAKLTRLPLSYFDSKKAGDIMQRMGDHKRIESFLTGSTLETFFSIINFFVFTFLVIVYDVKIFLIFLAGSTLYFLWVFLFLQARRNLDFKKFDLSAKNQNTTIQLIFGMQEIKLNNCERSKRWEWERIQAKLFKFNVKSLYLNQIQQGGAFFIHQAKNILITFFSATAVVRGDITLGGMLAIQYMMGQLNAPIQNFIQFIRSFQDAKISLERINEIHGLANEEPVEKQFLHILPDDRTITIKDLSYKYPGYDNDWVLNKIDVVIPKGKTTAIVGVSGSGKTTMLKLLLKFYQPEEGKIYIGDNKLENISPSFWRRQCGVVMQDGYIFSDSIANNIAVGDDYPDWSRLLHAVKVANIQEFIESLPLGYDTKIGAEGNGISQGQKQRILIARAVYKNPDYIFFDEATNSLDANNERIIMENLYEFFEGRTVVVVAHRLSTVKNADQIIVLENGKIVEMGTHDYLAEMKGNYYKLVKNQLELGN